MQEYLPIINATLLEWAQLALVNPFFTAALVFATALLVALIAKIRNIPLKRRAASAEKGRAELAGQLAATQEALGEAQGRLAQRNQQAAETLEALTGKFDLGETPVPAAAEDLAAETLWAQHARILNELAARLQTEQRAKAELQQSYQAEITKGMEKDAAIEGLKSSLAEKTVQISGLEQQAAEILEKHVAQAARVSELEQQSLAWLETKNLAERLQARLAEKESEADDLRRQLAARSAAAIQPPQSPIEPPVAARPVPAPVEPAPVAVQVQARDPEPVSIRPEPAVAPEPAPVPPPVFAPASPEVSARPVTQPSAAAFSEPVEAYGEPQAIVLSDWDYQPEIPVSPASGEDKPAERGLGGKLKGLFGKAEPKTSAKPAPAVESVPSAAAGDETRSEAASAPQSATGAAGKVAGLFGLSKKSADAGQNAAASEKQTSKIKNLFGRSK